jgi:hypothetical protein
VLGLIVEEHICVNTVLPNAEAHLGGVAVDHRFALLLASIFRAIRGVSPLLLWLFKDLQQFTSVALSHFLKGIKIFNLHYKLAGT